MIPYLLNISFFIVIAIIEAVIWTYVDDEEMPPNEKKQFHNPLVLLRVIWFGLMYLVVGWKKDLCLMACYPFWHLGVMYMQRNHLNPKVYKKRFFDTASSTTTSVIDNIINLSFTIRAICFIAGTITYFLL
jgi:hypothetical protein